MFLMSPLNSHIAFAVVEGLQKYDCVCTGVVDISSAKMARMADTVYPCYAESEFVRGFYD